MNRRQLFKQLNSLCREMDEEFFINQGGCCYVAAVIAENLEHCNIPHTIIHYDKCGCHYAIRVKDRIINRDHYNCNEIVYDKNISSKTLYNIYNEECWNETYNTKSNSTVRTKIKALFDKYENRRT
jgi:hypothetical protein